MIFALNIFFALQIYKHFFHKTGKIKMLNSLPSPLKLICLMISQKHVAGFFNRIFNIHNL